METGNPKQVAALSVMAVGAVGFLLTRLGGRGGSPVAPPSAAVRKTAPARVATLVLVKDPFSHPKLAPKETKVAPGASASEATETRVLRGAPTIFGSLPAVGVSDLGPAPVVPPKPVAKASKPLVPAPTTIGLEAIAGASDTVAFLAVGSAESRPFHPSERIAGAIRLLRVEDGAVVLSGPKGKLTLAVGERTTL